MGHSCRKLLRGTLLVGTLLIPPIIPLTSNTPRLHQHVSRSPVARRHANTLPTKAAQVPMALRHHECNFATRSAHTLEAFRTRRLQNERFVETSSKSHASSLQDERFVRDFLQKSRVKSPKRAFRTGLPPKVTRQVSKTSVSYETSSKSHTSSLQNERFVRDFLKNSHVKVCKTSVSYETSSKSQAETPIGAHTSRSPAKQFRDSSPSKQQSQCHSDIHLYHNSQPHDSLRLPRIFPRPHI